MDVYDLLSQTGLFTFVVVFYLIVIRGERRQKRGNYTALGWNYPLKLLWARLIVRQWKKKIIKRNSDSEDTLQPRKGLCDGHDMFTIRASAPDGTMILLVIRKLCGEKPLTESVIYLQLPDGSTYKSPRQPDTLLESWDSDEVWKAGGLKIDVLVPWRRLRIIFNGILVNTTSNTLHHIRLNLICTAAARPIRHPDEWNNKLAVEALAQVPWRGDNLEELLEGWNEGGTSQWISIQGSLQIGSDNQTPDTKSWLQARGISERWWSPFGHEGQRRSINIMVASMNGTAIHLRAISHKDLQTQIFSGTVRLPNTKIETIESTDLDMENFCENKNKIATKYTIHISTSNRSLKLILDIGTKGGRVLSGVPYQQELIYRILQAGINGDNATGILELGYDCSEEILNPSVSVTPPRVLKWLALNEINEIDFCAEFESLAASCPNIVGGKGASLSLLASIQQYEDYKVPPGFCLTTKAFEYQLEENSLIKDAICEIEFAGVNYDEYDFKKKCERTVELIKGAQIKGKLRTSILAHLSNLRMRGTEQHSYDEIRFAVRSSAVGEDSEALSAAGQNETVLGCVSDDDVLSAILKCWASMYAFTSVHYRRQNGQPCMTMAGVVIQILISPVSAGVMFTKHPQSGDPSKIIITANYGLGESVVSGSIEPDTFVISRDLDDNLIISSKNVGSKKYEIVASGNSTKSVNVSDSQKNTTCLSDDEALRLAKLAIRQEELWGAPRDIEWAINKNVIYLLQARPITSLEVWTEEELLHELDDPTMSDEDLVTFANTGEVLPKPMSALSATLIFEPLNLGQGKLIMNNPDIYELGVGLTHNRCVINTYKSLYRNLPPKLNATVRMMEMAIYGHTVADERIHAIAINRNPPCLSLTIKNIWLMIKTLLFARLYVRKAVNGAKVIKIDQLKVNDVHELLEAIVETNEPLQQISKGHGGATNASTVSQMIAMAVLMENSEDFSNEHCNDLNIMLSCGNAVSAEIPASLAILSQKLVATGKSGIFKRIPPENGIGWLKENTPEFYKDVQSFLDKHGYRAVMEFDLATVPWIIDPTGLIVVLQNMETTNNTATKLTTKTDEEIIASLVTPQKSITRKILRWILPISRSMVSKREKTKSQVILAIHKVRMAVRKLGALMVEEWMLPSMELIFYFTLPELRSYIETRDPRFLRKATQRRQYQQKWEKLKFAEMQEGWPKPIKTDAVKLLTGTKIKATPVCSGEVVARACVIQDLSEIDQLEQGDILITHGTDIGWSPYFPLLRGIVTELGGIISHGAVIARECGLPCIVGATGATGLFQTGDLVRLCGSSGLLEKVEQGGVNEEAK